MVFNDQMTESTIAEKDRDKVDVLVRDTESFDEKKLPGDLKRKLDEWKWGSYGWTSPANLIITACWYKYYHPEQDVCKIWAEYKGKPIPGGFSIRSADEEVTVQIFSKYELCEGFCSSNSGMQGARSLEKMREYARLDNELGSIQKTIYNLPLFIEIMNLINSCSNEEVLEVFKYLIVKAKQNKKKRTGNNSQLQSGIGSSFDFMAFLNKTADPELTKCVVGACLDSLFQSHGLRLEGIEDFKTAADARALKPGDLALYKDDQCKMAVEVKDKTQTIDWNNISRAKKILERHQTVESFIFALESTPKAMTDVIREIMTSDELKKHPHQKISVITVHDLYQMALVVTTKEELLKKISDYISRAPAMKPETKTAWLEKMGISN